MKRLLPLCALLTGMYFTLVSCSNDEQPAPGGNDNPPQDIVEQFNS